MSRWLSFLQPRFWGKVGRAVLGNVRYTPPAWPGGVFDSMCRSPGVWAATIVTAGVVIGGGLKYHEWAEAHKPHPRQIVEAREVTGKITAPGVTPVVEGKAAPQPVVLNFSKAAAKLDLVKKDNPPGISLSPAHPGHWRWATDKLLEFKPDIDWPAGTPFTVTLDAAQTPAEVKLKESRWAFTTPELLPQWSNVEFYTNPQDPEVHQVTAELNFTYPVKLEQVQKLIRVEVLGKSPLFNWGGNVPASLFTVEAGKAQRQFFLSSARIVIPAKEDFVKLTLAPGLQSLTGGKATGKEAAEKVRVPDIDSGFAIQQITSEIIRTAEGEPEQFIFVDTTGYAKPEEIAPHVQAWVLPKRNDRQWQGPNEATEAVLARSQIVKLKPVETAADEKAPMSTRHGFKFVSEKPGQMFVRVTAGAKALGGFRLAKPSATILQVPEFPKEVQIQGKGGLLAINGERKVSIKSRGVKHLRITLARVPSAQLNHLVRFTQGDFQAPEFNNYVDEENIAHFHRQIVPVAAKNDYEAAYSTFDFSAAVRAADVADQDGSRGLFFVFVEGVKPRGDEDTSAEDNAASDPDAIMSKWVSVDGQHYRSSEEQDSGAYSHRFILVTDLGLLVKRSSDGSRDLFVQSVSKGEPVAGATITTLAKNGEFLNQSVTDAEGHVHLANVEDLQREKQAVAFTARVGNDLAFIPFHKPDRLLDFSRFDTGGIEASSKDQLDAFVFTERGVYRPGDTVHVAAMVKRRDWEGNQEDLPLAFELYDAKEQLVTSKELPLSRDGYIEWNTRTAETDPTGQYEVRLSVIRGPDSRERIGRTAFRVEDFQPDRMKMTAVFSSPPGAAWVQPHEVKALVKVETLFGQPAAERRIVAKMMLSPADFAFEKFPGYTFHDRGPMEFKKENDEESEAGKKVELGEKKTDGEGKAEFDLGLERFDGGSFQLNLNAEVFEAGGGRSVQAGQSIMVAPMPYVIGYHSDTPLGYMSKDAASTLKLICLAPDLKPQAAPDLMVNIMRIRYVSVLTKQENGNYAYVSTRRETSISEAKFVLPAEGANYNLPSKEPGEFRFELRDSVGTVVCSTPFTIVGKGDTGRSLNREAELDMKLSKGVFNSGETLELSLTAPYTGAGLITVERNSLLGWKWFKSPTPATVQQILVPQGFDGTGYVSVAYVRSLDSPEVFISPLSYAVKPFIANPDRHRLAVQLDAPQRVKPGEVIKIGYTSAKTGRVVIYAVDEGIHQITSYKLPQPMTYFTRKRALETETHQLLDLILPEFSLLTRKASGGDEDAALKVNLNPFKRRKEAPVVFWSGIIESGPQRREVSYAVPDYFDGRLKIMAVALADDLVGAAETQCLSRGPMVITPTVPVFAAPGDEFTASLSVANNVEGPNASGTVDIQAIGSEQVEFVGSSQLKLEVALGHEATTTFRLRARDVPGGAEIIFKASIGAEKVERHATLSVRPSVPYLTEVKSGYFRQPTLDVKLDRVLYPHLRQSEATISALPLGLARGLEKYLRDYPHGCSEQITSRAMSRLLLSTEVDFGFDAGESAQQLRSAFAQLRSRQNGQGGFGYWAGDAPDAPSMDFLSVYVTQFLVEAADAGQTVPDGMMEQAKARMTMIARGKVTSLEEANIHAQAIYLLTRRGVVTTKYLLNLRDSLDKDKLGKWSNQVCAAFMGATYALLKQQGEGSALMTVWWRSADKTPCVTGWYHSYFTNPTVSQAQGFAVLCLHFPELAKNITFESLKMITDPIAANRFNTLTAAYSILALKAYSKIVAKSDVKLSISALLAKGDPQLILPDGGGVRSAPFNAGTAGLRFHLDKGSSDLGAFYQATESGFDKGIQMKEIADGLEVSRALLGKDGKPVTKLKVGETATMTLRVRNNSSDQLSNVALLDLMPGGFELVAGGLKPGRDALPGADYIDVREDRNVLYLHLGKAESKTFSYPVKPVSGGKFIIPPVFAESMYDRGIKGRNGGGVVEVE